MDHEFDRTSKQQTGTTREGSGDEAHQGSGSPEPDPGGPSAARFKEAARLAAARAKKALQDDPVGGDPKKGPLEAPVATGGDFEDAARTRATKVGGRNPGRGDAGATDAGQEKGTSGKVQRRHQTKAPSPSSTND